MGSGMRSGCQWLRVQPISLRLMGCIGEVVKNDVEELLETHEYHHDGQDLSEFPCIVNLDDARPNVRPIW